MATQAEIDAAKKMGFSAPGPSDLVRNGDDAITENAAATVRALDGIRPGLWPRANLTATDLNTLTGTANRGVYMVESTAVVNLPVQQLGVLEVIVSGASSRTRQIFSPTTNRTRSAWQRLYSAGAWSPWEPLDYVRGRLEMTADLDAQRSAGVWGIESTGHHGQPVAKVGTLEVLPSSGQLVQRFTTWEPVPRTYQRIASSGTAWGAWSETATASDVANLASRITELGSAAVGNGAVPRAPLAATGATIEPTPSGATIGALSPDRSRCWTALSTTLRYSDDDGRTWTDAYTFAGAAMESTMLLDDGEALCTGYVSARDRRVVWRSSGLATGKPTFTEVLAAPYDGIKFTSAWSQASYGRIVLLNEYGPKAGMAWPGVDGDAAGNVPTGEAAVRTYLSLDHGRTWKVIFNLHDYLTTQQGRADSKLQHLHGVAWDPYWDRIWVSFGDAMGGAGSNGVVFSDDLGATWEAAHYWPPGQGSAPWQVVGILPMPRCVMFFGDMTSAVMRVNRTEGKRAGKYTFDTAYSTTAAGKHLCQGATRARRAGDDAPALMAFSSEGVAAQDYLLGTLDGYTFTEVWRNTDAVPAGAGARSPIGPTIRGQFLATTNAHGGTVGSWGTLRIPATAY